MHLSRLVSTAAIAASALALTAGPALAKGGSPAPAPAPGPDLSWTLCPEYATVGTIAQPDGSVLFANEIGGIGCLIAKSSTSGLSISEVRTGAGWVSSVKSGSDPSKLDVQFTNGTTGEKHSILVEPGKTVIR